MGEKIVVGPISQGYQTNRTAFNIDNDAFPKIINAYQWRGRVKRKRGTSPLTRLRRIFVSTSTAYSSTPTIALVGGAANILTGFGLQSTGNIIPGTVTINNTTVPQAYTDPAMDGTLTGSLGGTGTINYATGAITITGGAGNSINASFEYYPGLPVMGLEDFTVVDNQYPQNVSFDTVYSYRISNTAVGTETFSPFVSYDVSFYKNPAANAALPGYAPKTTWTPVRWNGETYQQFWTTNYQNALWATNGIEVPFTVTNVGMQYKLVGANGAAVVSGTDVDFTTTTNHPFVAGDFIFANEFTGITGLNLQTGYVLAAPAPTATTFRARFPNATIAGGPGSNGIVQALTTSCQPDVSSTTPGSVKDCIRWYDGDPVSTSGVFSTGKGWVNFCPPLSNAVFSIADLPRAQYYLVGARVVLQFKDRLLFFGPVVQTQSQGSQTYLQDTIIYSQNGTPYYTASFIDAGTAATNPTTIFNPILLPDNQTSSPAAFFSDVTGFGGYIEAGYATPIISASSNEDVILLGFDGNKQARVIYTGNDIVPFNFFTINSELSTISTFSAVNMDRGVITFGGRGFIITTQVSCDRIDLLNPDQAFQVNLLVNGAERFTAARDYINEWIYFTYRSNQLNNTAYVYPTETFFYNYRDQSWGIFFETYTTYGQFRKRSGLTWATVGLTYPTWASWNEPWDSGTSTTLSPDVIGGNQQGYVVVKAEGTAETPSLAIQSISGSTITSPDHCLRNNDFIYITEAIGTIGTQINDKVFRVSHVTQNTFLIDPTISSGTYFGGGLITRLFRPMVQTKQFPVSWQFARKTRIGPQQYLFSTTATAQITLQIFLSQDSANPYNEGPIVPSIGSNNDSLIYSDILYTCPESTNLGLTPPNTNLNMITAASQAQTWHRMNTSLLGDTVQIGFTLSDDQMRDEELTNQFAEIELHSMILDVSPSQLLS